LFTLAGAVFFRRFGRMVDHGASEMHPVDSAHANVFWCCEKLKTPQKSAQLLQNYDRLMVSNINLRTCHSDSVI